MTVKRLLRTTAAGLLAVCAVAAAPAPVASDEAATAMHEDGALKARLRFDLEAASRAFERTTLNPEP